MKNEKQIEIPDGLELCDDCGFEYEEVSTCPRCKKQICKYCIDLHEHEDGVTNES